MYHYFQTDETEKIELYIHTGIAKAISGHCKCEFPVSFIRSGIFQCWNTPDEVTYRSVMVSPGGHKPTQLLQFLAEWVGMTVDVMLNCLCEEQQLTPSLIS